MAARLASPLRQWLARRPAPARDVGEDDRAARGNTGNGAEARLRRVLRQAREVFGIYSEPEHATEPRIHLLVSGRVQGVGFRAWVWHQAVELGLRGWVRNCRDGTVELEAAGPPHQLARLRELVSEGPALARVVAVRDEPPRWAPLTDDFEIR